MTKYVCQNMNPIQMALAQNLSNSIVQNKKKVKKHYRSDNRKGKLFAKSNLEKIKVKDFETFFAPEGQF